MNNPEGDKKFVPRMALAPSPQLYDELVGDSMEKLAAASLQHTPPIPAGSVIHDNGCGTGAGSAAVVESVSGHAADLAIKATDILDKALNVYKSRATSENWPAEALQMDSNRLTFEDNVFTHSIGNALLFVLPNDGKDALKEAYRTLKPRGTLIVNSWHYVPNMEPLQTAAKLTRPEGTPLPRQGMLKWSPPEFMRDVVASGGFSPSKIVMHKADVHCTTPELTHFAAMLWSFIGGTGEAGWLESDEENWDKAIEIIKNELRKTDGFEDIDGGRAKLKFVANIAIATKYACCQRTATMFDGDEKCRYILVVHNYNFRDPFIRF